MEQDLRRPGESVVSETGLALVHAGERIRPAPGSAATLLPAADDPASVVEYHFPVVVEVRESVAPDVDAVAALAVRRVVEGLRA